MDTKKKFYWLWGAIGLLLLLNLITVGWVIRRVKVLRTGRQNTEEIMIRRLNFTPGQVAQYRQSRSQMQTQIKPCEDRLRVLRTRLFGQINPSITSDTAVSQVLAEISQQNAEMARRRFQHWQRVRALGTPDQQARFDQLLARLNRSLNRVNQPGGLREQLRDRF